MPTTKAVGGHGGLGHDRHDQSHAGHGDGWANLGHGDGVTYALQYLIFLVFYAMSCYASNFWYQT